MEKTLEKNPIAREADQQRELPQGTLGEIRVLDELELMLAGGGEGDTSWP